MGAGKNLLKGFIFMIFYVGFTIILPFLTFSYINTLQIMGIDFGLAQESYDRIIYWIVAFGCLISGTAFFTYSSPKQSIRKGVFALVQIILNCLYLWSYKFSGATDVNFEIIGYGHMTINLQQMILVYMGIYFLTIAIKIYDLIDFTINRDKIREKRWSE
ncbi:MAG: hypothetical protein GF317_24495 [Candidatus Lokiarchaeota archaeon]|nr:hypothetical protein [Candidatus Lokiarchaeota archaeon]MBD3202534.1 hypothetical protein [Candidatus Lokiarchaeota archaeon]